MIKKILLVLLLTSPQIVFSQSFEPVRPPVWGIAKMTFLVTSFQYARNYYGKFLGFDEAFTYNSEAGKILSFKVNDRQFLEFIEDSHARGKNRLVSVSFETENVEQMRLYLSSKGITTPSSVILDGAGNERIVVSDPSGCPVEFIKFMPGSLHKKSIGKYLSQARISKRIHHAGLVTYDVLKNDEFYKDIMGFKMIWRYPEEGDEDAIVYAYLQIPDCTEMIEYFVSNDPNVSNFCFLVDDMQETIYTLKERQNGNAIDKPVIGKGKRWILNMKNEDGPNVEFTEAHTVR